MNEHFNRAENLQYADAESGPNLHPPDEGADTETHDESIDESHPGQNEPGKRPAQMQKRRRVTRACDECRRKKIKCDGKQPCTHCTVYSYECTYDQPSNRRRNPTPQYIEALESRLQKAEEILRILAPELNLSDPRLITASPEQIVASIRRADSSDLAVSNPLVDAAPKQEPESFPDGSLLETMMENSGSLDLDDQGHWDYHGHSSGIIFMQRLKKQIGNVMALPSRPLQKSAAIFHKLDSPISQSESPQELSNPSSPPTHDLPPKDVAKRLCRSALDHACILMRLVHEPSFFATFDRIYTVPVEQYTNEEHTFLPLLYVVMAVGCLFSDDHFESTLDKSGYEGAIGQGFQYFKASRQLLEITDCRDLTTLQAICFMILFLQSSAKLSTCYSYIGLALRASLRLGLHRTVIANFDPVESELRKRIFWLVRKMDIYVSTLLGLPQMVSNEDIDQEYPLDIDDEFITHEAILPMPSDRISFMAGANAHTRLAEIMVKVVRYIYPVKLTKSQSKSDHTYMVSHSKIREIERDLQSWMESLPPALRPGSEVHPDLERQRQLLRIGYAHVQMVMYRPFLHYVSNSFQAQGIDKRSYACAAACVSVSRNVVHITTGLYKKGLLNGSYWFVMYTTYFAILSLVFFVLENPDLSAAKDGILKDALEGKMTLDGLAKKSLAADRCAQSLNGLFKQLPEKLRNRQNSAASHVNLKRASPSDSTIKSRFQRPASMSLPFETPQRANSFPTRLANAHPRQTHESKNSVDDTRVPRRSQTWLWDGHSDSADSTMSPDSTSAFSQDQTTSPVSAQYMNQSQAPAQQPFTSSNQLSAQQILPDLTPIMFPSGDQFAYPAPPLSTLEDDHFKEEISNSPMQYSQDPFTSATGSNQLNGNFSQNITTDLNGNVLGGIQGLPGPFVTGSAATLAPQLQHLGLHTPSTHSSTPDSTIQGPDLVSLPHNYMWQSFSLSNPTAPNNDSAAMKEQSYSDGKATVFDDGEVDKMSSLGMMGFDMDVNFNEIFGNIGTNPNAATNMNDEWGQWMNTGA